MTSNFFLSLYLKVFETNAPPVPRLGLCSPNPPAGPQRLIKSTTTFARLHWERLTANSISTAFVHLLLLEVHSVSHTMSGQKQPERTAERSRLMAGGRPTYGALEQAEAQSVVTVVVATLPRSRSSAAKLGLNNADLPDSSITCIPHVGFVYIWTHFFLTVQGCSEHDLFQALSTRILALLLMSLLGFGSFFCFDNPGALQSQV